MLITRKFRHNVKAVLGVGGVAIVIGWGWWLAPRAESVPILLAAALIAGLVIAALVAWEGQRRAWNQWQDVVDAFAEREIARAARDKSPRKTRPPRLARRAS
jgi:MFS superfamily sulfate permease-like transporter